MTSPKAVRRAGGIPRNFDGGDDVGSGTVWVLAVTAFVALMAAVVVGFVEVRVVRFEAASAADLAALAAASALPDTVAACSAARDVAEAQGARLVACEPAGLVVDVVVSRVLSGPFAGLSAVTVRARAGPPKGP